MRLRNILSLIFGGLLIVTAGGVGWIGYSSNHRTLKRFTQYEFALANATAANHIGSFLNGPANRLLDELSHRAQRGMLRFDNDEALGLDLGERLRVDEHLAWISYSDAKTGHFVGVWRNVNHAIILNRSTPGQGPAREQVITPDGKLVDYHRSQPQDYDPRIYSWYKNAYASSETAWSEPYDFAEGDLGITASRAWRQNGVDVPAGVFTVDFYLKDLEALITGIASSTNGFFCVLEPDGKLLFCSQQPDKDALTKALSDWVKANPQFKSIDPQVTNHLIPIDAENDTYLTALYRLETSSGLKCIVASMVPEKVIYGGVDEARFQMIMVSLLALAIAVSAGWIMASRVSNPLRVLGDDLAKVGQFHLAASVARRSLVQEVNQLRDAADRMKSGLRSFMRYVPDDLVRQILSTGKEAALGGENRTMTLFFSDIEGFTTYSEQVTPNVLVLELSEYFQILSSTLRSHSGTIGQFIGDGLLAFFNAPLLVTDHEKQSCRAALEALKAMESARIKQDGAVFRTRVGLHCGEVLVGNMGTPDRLAYSVLGDAVNTASRLEGLNKFYGTQIIASEQLRAKTGDDFEWRHLDRVSVAGRKGAMEIYELLGVKGNAEPARLLDRDLYEQALGHYFGRSFDEAAKFFERVAHNRPDDKAANLMKERCERMMAIHPPLDWDGVYVYSEK